MPDSTESLNELQALTLKLSVAIWIAEAINHGVSDFNARLRVIELVRQVESLLPNQQPTPQQANYINIRNGVAQTISTLTVLGYEIKKKEPTVVATGGM